MKIIECLLLRDVFEEKFTLGQFYISGKHYAFTCEDKDRHLEVNGVAAKVDNETAIPRGRYRLTVSMSQRFGKLMTELVGVPYFSGVRIHGGNTDKDTRGCPLIGNNRTATGVSDCREVVEELIRTVQAEERLGNVFYVTVR